MWYESTERLFDIAIESLTGKVMGWIIDKNGNTESSLRFGAVVWALREDSRAIGWEEGM